MSYFSSLLLISATLFRCILVVQTLVAKVHQVNITLFPYLSGNKFQREIKVIRWFIFSVIHSTKVKKNLPQSDLSRSSRRMPNQKSKISSPRNRHRNTQCAHLAFAVLGIGIKFIGNTQFQSSEMRKLSLSGSGGYDNLPCMCKFNNKLPT